MAVTLNNMQTLLNDHSLVSPGLAGILRNPRPNTPGQASLASVLAGRLAPDLARMVMPLSGRLPQSGLQPALPRLPSLGPPSLAAMSPIPGSNGNPIQPRSVPTPAPPAAETSLPAVADPEGKAPQSAALAHVIREEQRPDLGFLGNLIRTQTGSDFSKDLFENYWLGKGDYRLSDSRFQDIVNYIDTSKPSYKLGGNVMLPDGTQLTKRVYDFYGSPEYRNALGSASVYLNQAGKPVGFYDYYNFDPDPTGAKGRSPSAERKVDIMAKIGPWHGAVPFPLSYGQYVPPTSNP